MNGYTQGFGPVSSNLSHALMLPHTEVSPGDTLVILEYWVDGDIPFIALVDPTSEDSHVEYSIRMIAENELDVFLVLQAPPEWWDPEEEDPPQTVVRIVAGVIVQCLHDHEAESLIPVLQSIWQNHSYLSAFEQKQLLVSQSQELFNHFSLLETDTEESDDVLAEDEQEAADPFADHTTVQRREMAEQKDPNRLQDPKRAKFASLKFGRPELIGDDGAILVKGMSARALRKTRGDLVARKTEHAPPEDKRLQHQARGGDVSEQPHSSERPATAPVSDARNADEITVESERPVSQIRTQALEGEVTAQPDSSEKPVAAPISDARSSDEVPFESEHSVLQEAGEFDFAVQRDEQETYSQEIEDFMAELWGANELQDFDPLSEPSPYIDDIVQQQTPAGLIYPDGTTRKFEFDDQGLHKVTNPDGSILHRAKIGLWIEIDAYGDVTGELLEADAVSVDNSGNFMLRNGDGSTMHHWADGTKLETGTDGMEMLTNPDGSAVMLSAGRPYLVTHPEGGARAFDYDEQGHVSLVQDRLTGLRFEKRGDTWYMYLDIAGQDMAESEILDRFQGIVEVTTYGAVHIVNSGKKSTIHPNGRWDEEATQSIL